MKAMTGHQFIPPLRIAAAELEWASGVMVQKSASFLPRIGDTDLGTRTPASLMAAWGRPDMRVLLAWLIVLGAFVGSATAFGIWGSRKVAAHIPMQQQCFQIKWSAQPRVGQPAADAKYDCDHRLQDETESAGSRQPLRYICQEITRKQIEPPALEGLANRGRQPRRIGDAFSVQAECARHRGVVAPRQRGADHAAAVVDLLVVALDVPRRVVGDDDDHLRAMTRGGIDLHRIDAERAVAGDDDDLAIRIKQRRGYAVRRADAQTAECADLGSGAELRAWYVGHLRPRLEEAVAAGIVEPGGLEALDVELGEFFEEPEKTA